MTGKELIKWIEENNAEDMEFVARDVNNHYEPIEELWITRGRVVIEG